LGPVNVDGGRWCLAGLSPSALANHKCLGLAEIPLAPGRPLDPPARPSIRLRPSVLNPRAAGPGGFVGNAPHDGPWPRPPDLPPSQRTAVAVDPARRHPGLHRSGSSARPGQGPRAWDRPTRPPACGQPTAGRARREPPRRPARPPRFNALHRLPKEHPSWAERACLLVAPRYRRTPGAAVSPEAHQLSATASGPWRLPRPWPSPTGLPPSPRAFVPDPPAGCSWLDDLVRPPRPWRPPATGSRSCSWPRAMARNDVPADRASEWSGVVTPDVEFFSLSGFPPSVSYRKLLGRRAHMPAQGMRPRPRVGRSSSSARAPSDPESAQQRKRRRAARLPGGLFGRTPKPHHGPTPCLQTWASTGGPSFPRRARIALRASSTRARSRCSFLVPANGQASSSSARDPDRPRSVRRQKGRSRSAGRGPTFRFPRPLPLGGPVHPPPQQAP